MIEAHDLLAHLVCTIFTLRSTDSYLWIHRWCRLNIINLVLDIYTLELFHKFLYVSTAVRLLEAIHDLRKKSDAYCAESTWRFARPFDALHICSLYHATTWYCKSVEILKNCSPSQYCNLFCCHVQLVSVRSCKNLYVNKIVCFIF